MHLLGRVAVGAGVAQSAVDDRGCRQAAAYVGGQVGRPVAGLGDVERRSSLIQERLRGDGLGGVGREVIGHQLQEGAVAQLEAQRVEEQNAPGALQLDTGGIVLRAEFEATIDGAAGRHGARHVTRLQHLAVGRGTCYEPRVGRRSGKQPALPQTVAIDRTRGWRRSHASGGSRLLGPRQTMVRATEQVVAGGI